MEVNASLTCVPVLFSNGVWPIGGPTVAEELCRDVRFALGFKVVKKLRPLTDSERDLVAAAIVEHIRLCNWKVERGPPWEGLLIWDRIKGAGPDRLLDARLVISLPLSLRMYTMFASTQIFEGAGDVAKSKFFEERTDQSEVKARIVLKYFYAWANVIMPTAKKLDNKIAYIDLYAGPGRYKDGAASTPLLVLEHAIADPKLSKMLVALFNDIDENHSETLKEEIKKLPGIGRLKHQPEVLCGPIDEDAERYFTQTRLVPSFTFVDPFGYKGLSLKIVNGVIKDWGCDCVFFFNYNRINAGMTNPSVEKHIDSLFGEERAARLRALLASKQPHEREEIILEELAQAIKEMGGKFVLPFRFKNASGKRTSHSLVFVTKHFKGYEIMKGIMAKESSTFEQGVPSLTYSPADRSMPLLFSLSRPLDALKDMLVKEFSGRTLSMLDIYRETQRGYTLYQEKLQRHARPA